MPKIEPPYVPKNPPKLDVVSYNGADFHIAFWSVPEGVETKARILFVHGFCEEYRLYLEIFDELSGAGYEVFFFEQRGAGRTSPGKLRGHTNEKFVVDDLDFFIERNISEIGDGKLFLGGHSMGGGIILNYGVTGKHRDRLAGIFCTGPLVRVHPVSLPNKLVVAAGKIAVKFLPNMKMDSDLNVDNVTSNEKWHKFIEHNEHIVPMVGTLRQMDDFLIRGERLTKPEFARKFDTTPLLVIHGTADKVNDPEATKQFFQLAAVEDKTLILPEGCRHSCFLETEPHYATTRDAVLDWLERH